MRLSLITLLLLSFVTLRPALADDTLTFQQIEELLGALRLIDAGSPDQCAPAKDVPAPQKPCPYRKSFALIRSMAQDIVALGPADSEYKIAQNAIRLEILQALPPSSQFPADKDPANAERDSRYAEKMMPLLAQKKSVLPLARLKMADLDVGAAPEHNQLSATVIAALAPIIEDFSGK